MDLTESIAPKSDQLNAEDLLTGPRTFTVAEVKKGSAEQPVDIHLVEFPGRPFRPSKTVRRILVNAWGAEASAYVGRRMTLYRDPAVKFGGMDVGGIRVSHLSHIDKPLSVALTVSRGKRAPYTVKPLPDLAVANPAIGPRVSADAILAAIDPRQTMFALLKGQSRDEVLAIIAGIVGHDVAASSELTDTEVDEVVAALEAAS